MTAAAQSTPRRLLGRIEAAAPRLTRAERLVAAYLTANAQALTLETAASVARKAGVSPMTVGRFLRTLGYAGFNDLRQESAATAAAAAAGPEAWRMADRYARFAQDGGSGDGAGDSVRERSLDTEIKALAAAYRLASGERWAAVVQRVAMAEQVFVAGFQTVRGVAMDFAARLEYVRSGVGYLDGANGTYAEVFATDGSDGVGRRCLVLVDIRRYARQAQLLAAEAAAGGVPVAIVTDAFCHWARRCTDDVFHVQTEVGLFWDSNAAITSLLNLLLNDVIGVLGEVVGSRAKRLQALQGRFGAFLD